MRDKDFVNCLAYGKIAEQKAQELFLYDKIEYAPTKCAEYDFMMTINDSDLYFEVKNIVVKRNINKEKMAGKLGSEFLLLE
jgi:hypothetical protein